MEARLTRRKSLGVSLSKSNATSLIENGENDINFINSISSMSKRRKSCSSPKFSLFDTSDLITKGLETETDSSLTFNEDKAKTNVPFDSSISLNDDFLSDSHTLRTQNGNTLEDEVIDTAEKSDPTSPRHSNNDLADAFAISTPPMTKKRGGRRASIAANKKSKGNDVDSASWSIDFIRNQDDAFENRLAPTEDNATLEETVVLDISERTACRRSRRKSVALFSVTNLLSGGVNKRPRTSEETAEASSVLDVVQPSTESEGLNESSETLEMVESMSKDNIETDPIAMDHTIEGSNEIPATEPEEAIAVTTEPETDIVADIQPTEAKEEQVLSSAIDASTSESIKFKPKPRPFIPGTEGWTEQEIASSLRARNRKARSMRRRKNNPRRLNPNAPLKKVVRKTAQGNEMLPVVENDEAETDNDEEDQQEDTDMMPSVESSNEAESCDDVIGEVFEANNDKLKEEQDPQPSVEQLTVEAVIVEAQPAVTAVVTVQEVIIEEEMPQPTESLPVDDLVHQMDDDNVASRKKSRRKSVLPTPPPAAASSLSSSTTRRSTRRSVLMSTPLSGSLLTESPEKAIDAVEGISTEAEPVVDHNDSMRSEPKEILLPESDLAQVTQSFSDDSESVPVIIEPLVAEPTVVGESDKEEPVLTEDVHLVQQVMLATEEVEEEVQSFVADRSSGDSIVDKPASRPIIPGTEGWTDQEIASSLRARKLKERRLRRMRRPRGIHPDAPLQKVAMNAKTVSKEEQMLSVEEQKESENDDDSQQNDTDLMTPEESSSQAESCDAITGEVFETNNDLLEDHDPEQTVENLSVEAEIVESEPIVTEVVAVEVMAVEDHSHELPDDVSALVHQMDDDNVASRKRSRRKSVLPTPPPAAASSLSSSTTRRSTRRSVLMSTPLSGSLLTESPKQLVEATEESEHVVQQSSAIDAVERVSTETEPVVDHNDAILASESVMAQFTQTFSDMKETVTGIIERLEAEEPVVGESEMESGPTEDVHSLVLQMMTAATPSPKAAAIGGSGGGGGSGKAKYRGRSYGGRRHSIVPGGGSKSSSGVNKLKESDTSARMKEDLMDGCEMTTNNDSEQVETADGMDLSEDFGSRSISLSQESVGSTEPNVDLHSHDAATDVSETVDPVAENTTEPAISTEMVVDQVFALIASDMDVKLTQVVDTDSKQEEECGFREVFNNPFASLISSGTEEDEVDLEKVKLTSNSIDAGDDDEDDWNTDLVSDTLMTAESDSVEAPVPVEEPAASRRSSRRVVSKLPVIPENTDVIIPSSPTPTRRRPAAASKPKAVPKSRKKTAVKEEEEFDLTGHIEFEEITANNTLNNVALGSAESAVVHEVAVVARAPDSILRSATKKSVLFGSPSAVEFMKTKPTTNLTPLSRCLAKSLFSMEMKAERTVLN